MYTDGIDHRPTITRLPIVICEQAALPPPLHDVDHYLIHQCFYQPHASPKPQLRQFTHFHIATPQTPPLVTIGHPSFAPKITPVSQLNKHSQAAAINGNRSALNALVSNIIFSRKCFSGGRPRLHSPDCLSSYTA